MMSGPNSYMNVAEISGKYRDAYASPLREKMSPVRMAEMSASKIKNSVTRHLIQGSVRKEERMKYADPDDHSFNYTRRYIGGPSMYASAFADRDAAGEWATPARRGASAYAARDRITATMPPIRAGPLNKVKPISNEDEDELIQILKDVIQHESELEDAKVQLIQHADFNLLDAFQLADVESKGWVTAPQLQECL